jgi:outer membrane protein TolC
MVRIQEDTARLDIVRKNLQNELAYLLGWENTDSLNLAKISVDSIAGLPVPPVAPQSLADNPILASYDSRVKAQRFRTNEMAADHIPHVMLGSGYVGDGDPTGDGNYWRIDAGVVIPIYSGRALVYQKHGSEAMAESLDAQRNEIERELMIHLVKVHEKLVKLKDLLTLQNQRQSISSRAVGFAEMNYKAGISTNLDYLSAQQQLTDTELAIEETRLEYTMSLIEYYIATNQVEDIIALGNNP